MLSIERTAADSPTAFAHLLGITLHAGQVQWLENHAQVKVACCGRRWGKSFAEALDLLWFAAIHRGSSQFLIAPTFDQVTTIFKYAVQMVTASELFSPFIDHVVMSPFPELQVFGSFIHARSSGKEGQNVRSKGADRVIYDEAAFIPGAARAAIAPLLANSDIHQEAYISSPWGKNYFWELFLKGQTGEEGHASFQFPSWSSPHVSRAYLKQQQHDLTSLAYSIEYGAEFADDQNSVFNYELVRAAVSEIDPEPQPGRRYVIGWDPAKWHDRSAVAVLDISEKPWQLVRIDDLAGRDYEPQMDHVAKMSAQYWQPAGLVDSTHNEPLLEGLKKRKLHISGFDFTNASKEELINSLVLAFEHGDLRIPNEPDLLKELLYYRYELTAAGNVRLGAPPGVGHYDDLVTALALAVQAANQNRPVRSIPPVVSTGTSRWGSPE